jgi:hypothetical protein
MSKENKTNKSLEDFLLDVNVLKESVTGNAKEILRTVSREEIMSALNESLEDEEEDIDLDMDDAGEETEFPTADAEGGEESDASEFETSMEDDTTEVDVDMDSELELDGGSMEGSEDYDSMEGMASDEDDFEFDLTNVSDDEVISVFKKLQDNDEVEIIDNSEVHITDPESGNEYQIKMGGNAAAEAPVTDMPAELPAVDMESEEDFDIESDIDVDMDTENVPGEEEADMDYEIELDADMGDEEEPISDDEEEDEVNEDIVRGKGHDKHLTPGTMPSGDIEGTKADMDPLSGDNLQGGFDDDAVNYANAEGPMVMEDEMNEEELDESIPVGKAQSKAVKGKNAEIGQPKGAGAKMDEKVVSESKYNALLSKHRELMAENKEFESSLKKFRNMLNEVATFNANLTYATRLFTEHSTTKEEKNEILKRFDAEAGNLKESKKVFKQIQESLKKRTPLNESANKLNAEPKSSSKSQINESTAYEDASTRRMRDLMRKLNK